MLRSFFLLLAFLFGFGECATLADPSPGADVQPNGAPLHL